MGGVGGGVGGGSRLRGPGCGHTLGQEQRRSVEVGARPPGTAELGPTCGCGSPAADPAQNGPAQNGPAQPRSLGVGRLHGAAVGTQEENSVKTHERQTRPTTFALHSRHAREP